MTIPTLVNVTSWKIALQTCCRDGTGGPLDNIGDVSVTEILKLHHEVTADIELKPRTEDNNFKTCYHKYT